MVCVNRQVFSKVLCVLCKTTNRAYDLEKLIFKLNKARRKRCWQHWWLVSSMGDLIFYTRLSERSTAAAVNWKPSLGMTQKNPTEKEACRSRRDFLPVFQKPFRSTLGGTSATYVHALSAHTYLSRRQWLPCTQLQQQSHLNIFTFKIVHKCRNGKGKD
jgi:hypothetical protein